MTAPAHTSLFDFEWHVVVGPESSTAAASVPVPPHYHERVPDPGGDPVTLLDGGLRVHTSLLVIQPALAATGRSDVGAFARTFAREDLPRLLQLVPADTLVLLPPDVASAVAQELPGGTAAAGAGADDPAERAWRASLAAHVVAHDPAPALYYAKDAFVFTCTCEAA
jgi:hypothetical protein